MILARFLFSSVADEFAFIITENSDASSVNNFKLATRSSIRSLI